MREEERRFWRLSELLGEWTEEANIGKRLRAEMASLRWAEVVGEVIASRTKVERVEGGTLIVATESPAWSNEISLRKAQIMERLNRAVGEEVIKDIRCVVRKRAREGKGERPRLRRPRPDFSRLTPAMLREVEDTTRKVSDPEIRAALRKAMLSHYAVEAARLSALLPREEHGGKSFGFRGRR